MEKNVIHYGEIQTEIKNKNNKEEIKYGHIIADRLDELISKTQTVVSTINNSARMEELF